MYEAIVSAATLLAMTLASALGVHGPARAASAPIIQFDRLSVTKRLLSRLGSARPSRGMLRPNVLPPIAGYRSIRRVDFLAAGGSIGSPFNALGFVTDVNNSGQISYYPALNTLGIGRNGAVIGPSYVIDDDGTAVPLSESVIAPLEGPGLNIAYIQANALNDVGGVAGIYSYLFAKPSGVETGFLGNLGWQLTKGTYAVSYFDGYAAGAQAFAINNHNVAAGQGSNATIATYQATLFSPTAARHALLPLATAQCTGPGSYEISQATGINDAGQVVGYEESFNFTVSPICEATQAVRFSQTGYGQQLFVPQPEVVSVAEAINQRGDIVGYVGKKRTEAFLQRATSARVTYIPRPTGELTGAAQALAVNSRGDVVGNILIEQTNVSSAFLFTRGRTYDLNALLPPGSGWTIVTAVAINDAREIIGYGWYQDPATTSPVMAAYAMKP